jgi:hypothetical protein
MDALPKVSVSTIGTTGLDQLSDVAQPIRAWDLKSRASGLLRLLRLFGEKARQDDAEPPSTIQCSRD